MTITSAIINSILDGVAFGKKTDHGSLTMLPLRSEGAGGLEYLTLAEALDTGFARVSEVSEGGSVPDLRLANTGSLPVLVIDGEGAPASAVFRKYLKIKRICAMVCFLLPADGAGFCIGGRRVLHGE